MRLHYNVVYNHNKPTTAQTACALRLFECWSHTTRKAHVWVANSRREADGLFKALTATGLVLKWSATASHASPSHKVSPLGYYAMLNDVMSSPTARLKRGGRRSKPFYLR